MDKIEIDIESARQVFNSIWVGEVNKHNPVIVWDKNTGILSIESELHLWSNDSGHYIISEPANDILYGSDTNDLSDSDLQELFINQINHCLFVLRWYSMDVGHE